MSLEVLWIGSSLLSLGYILLLIKIDTLTRKSELSETELNLKISSLQKKTSEINIELSRMRVDFDTFSPKPNESGKFREMMDSTSKTFIPRATRGFSGETVSTGVITGKLDPLSQALSELRDLLRRRDRLRTKQKNGGMSKKQSGGVSAELQVVNRKIKDLLNNH
jgi:CRISPR/Cas system-associated protein Cas10 (large subunit of type III CRISPR-Cas system)